MLDGSFCRGAATVVEGSFGHGLSELITVVEGSFGHGLSELITVVEGSFGHGLSDDNRYCR